MVRQFAADKGIEVTDVTDKQKAGITKRALEHYYTALEDLHGTLSDSDKQEIARHLVPPTAVDVESLSTEES
jgi:hypothetical protein